MKKLILSVGIMICSLFIFHTAASAQSNYEKLLPVAQKYLGVPYAWGGTSANGFDCSGYILTVFKELGITLPRTSSSMYNVGTKVSKSDLRAGDLVFFNTYGSGVSHAGIYIGNNEFIHASSNKGVTISNINDPYYWGSRYIGAKRILSHNAPQGQFRDVSSSLLVYPAVNKLAEENIIQGYENSYFKPNQFIKRSEVAGLMAQAFHMKMNDRSQSFKDISSSHWAVGVINAVRAEGIFEGSNNSFRPDEYLNRAQMAAILVRAFNLNGSSSKEFTDVPSSYWAHSYINKLAASGLTTGYDDGTYKPENHVTRAQFTAFLYRGMY
ncbi:hydrolase Nlp/P60 [Rossellomorea vietnamensis]|uniref:Hydrolase Nlp/P60 n=1 Tax=Rossellomorea vietnamensis TaxID=218284 RepID=A0A5D4M149_9BACI|nr:C40 family peptidase [Rossellomorea vietnamensis]TYR94875.1 hydrolase Nlp/P60 [Rossellomorea vietnamensis]